MAVDNQAIASLSVKALETAFARGIGARRLDYETIVNENTLAADSGIEKP